MSLVAAKLLAPLTAGEEQRMAKVESVLDALRSEAAEADRLAVFPASHVKTLADADLLGLVVPVEYGGLGGGLRDLVGAAYAMGAACPSTALAFFFHCSSSSRGLLALEAIEAGLFSDDEVPVVRAFGEKVLRLMGTERKWLANFASESVKAAGANVFIQTEATKVDGGWRINGTKSFGCATGIADYYLVTAKVEGTTTAEGLGIFLVARDSEGVGERKPWDGIGMRASANHGITLEQVFVADEDALAVPGAFVRMMQCSRGSFVGNQVATTAIYVGIAQAAYDEALARTTKQTFADTGEPIATSPMHQVLFGQMTQDLESAYQWLRRQTELEASEPPLLPKPKVLEHWRLAKGAICDLSFQVGIGAFKACGTSGADNSGVIARAMRDLSMGLVMAFPSERGRLEAAQMVVTSRSNTLFATAGSNGT